MPRAKTSKFFDRLRTSYWFLPSVMTASSVVMAVAVIYFDRHYQLSIPWLYSGDADGARSLLSMIAGSMITVAGVTFSITIVALSLASSQFGPRLLRNFLRDRVEQIVLGTFLATFTYSLLVLRTIRTDPPEFVPHLSVTVSILLAMTSLSVLIYFIHHIAVTIQAPVIVAGVGKELRNAIVEVFPDEQVHPPRWTVERSIEDSVPENFESESYVIRLKHGGYVQAIDEDALFELACKHKLVIAMRCRPGDFLSTHDEACRVWPRSRATDHVLNAARRAVIHGGQRTLIQDVRFAIAQLVEVAAIALSPGVNEPFTAVSCIHWLTDSFVLIADRPQASPYHFEDGSYLRVVYQELTLHELLDDAFNPVRRMGAELPMVMDALMEGYFRIAPRLRSAEDRNHLMDHAKRALDVADKHKQCAADVEKLQHVYAEILKILQHPDPDAEERWHHDRSLRHLTGENRPEQ